MLDETDGPVHPSGPRTHMSRLCKIPEQSLGKVSSRQGSLDTLSGQESIASDGSILDLEERYVIIDMTIGCFVLQSDVAQEVLDVQTMLVKLKTILLEVR